MGVLIMSWDSNIVFKIITHLVPERSDIKLSCTNKKVQLG